MGYVGVLLGNIAVAVIYISLSRSRLEFEEFLRGVVNFVLRQGSLSVIVLGDFNVHSTVWGFRRTGPRGSALLEWAAGLNLVCLNTGAESTCVA